MTIDGAFPTTVPVYVWFGDSWSTSVRADASGTRITVATPPVPYAGVRDVIIRFTTDQAVELRLVDAFEFTDGTTPTTSTSTPPAAGGGTGGGATTVPSWPTTTLAPTPTAPGTTTPATTQPGTTAPDTTISLARPLGRLTLRTVPAGSALSGLHISAWPGTGCRTASCPGTEI